MYAVNQIIKSKDIIYNFYRENELSLHVFVKLLPPYDESFLMQAACPD